MSIDRVKVPAEDRNQVQAEVNGHRYNQRNGFFEMHPLDAKLHLADAGYGRSWHVHGIASRGAGYTCPDCGFASFFKECSRCRDREDQENARTSAQAAHDPHTSSQESERGTRGHSR